jgi:hypothetical protein
LPQDHVHLVDAAAIQPGGTKRPDLTYAIICGWRQAESDPALELGPGRWQDYFQRMEKSPRLPFSWWAFLLAPWPVPLTCIALLSFGGQGRPSVVFFFLSLAVALVISYLGTAALVVSLHFVAQARPVTRTVSAVTGVLLAGLAYLPFLYLSWGASGPDSGPPTESFLWYLLRNWNDPVAGIFLAGGLVSALIYDTLARRHRRDQ